MGRCILITSGKGGVGKTTLTSNLAATLATMGYNTVAVDANITTPNLGIHLGMHLTTRTLHDVLRGEEKVERSMYPHPLGFKVVPGSISVNSLEDIRYGKLSSIVLKLLGQFDFVLLDSAAGLGEETMVALESVSEVLVITNPDLPSVTEALKTIKHANKKSKSVVGFVVNRVKRASHELDLEQIKQILGVPLLGVIPEDAGVSKSIHRKIPLVDLYPKSPAARAMGKITHRILEKPYHEADLKNGFWKRFLDFWGY